MMRELCLRNGVSLPAGDVDAPDPVAMRVFVIRAVSSGSMLEDIATEMRRRHAEVEFTEDATELETADRVIVGGVRDKERGAEEVRGRGACV